MTGSGSGNQIEGFTDRLKFVIGDESVNSFANKCGFSEGMLRKYLTGSIPGFDKVIAIAEAANVSIDWLATGKETENSRNISGCRIDPQLLGIVGAALREAEKKNKDLPKTFSKSLYRIANIYNRIVGLLPQTEYQPIDDVKIQLVNDEVQYLVDDYLLDRDELK